MIKNKGITLIALIITIVILLILLAVSVDLIIDGKIFTSAATGTEWVVFGREDSNKDGKYETLLITILAPSTEKLTLGEVLVSSEAWS